MNLVVPNLCEIEPYNKYMSFAGWDVRIVKNCDLRPGRGQHFQARGEQFFTIRTDPRSANINMLFLRFFFSLPVSPVRSTCSFLI